MNKKNKLLSITCLSMALGGIPFQAAANEGTASKAERLYNRTIKKYIDNPTQFADCYGATEVTSENWYSFLQAYELYLNSSWEFRTSVDQLLDQRGLPPVRVLAADAIQVLNTFDEATRIQWEPVVENLRMSDPSLPQVRVPVAVTVIEDSPYYIEVGPDSKDPETSGSSGNSRPGNDQQQSTESSQNPDASKPESGSSSKPEQDDETDSDKESADSDSADAVDKEESVVVLPEAENPEDTQFETNVHPSQIGNQNVDPANQPVLELNPDAEESPDSDEKTPVKEEDAVIQEVVGNQTPVPNGGQISSGTPQTYTAPAITVTNTYADARPTVFDTSTLDNITEGPSVFSTSYNFNVLHGVNRTIHIDNLGSFSLLPDFTNEAAWKGSVSGYNTPGLWGQCTWFAWGRFYELYGFDPGFTGNGYQCVSQLLAAHPDKFSLSKNPASGAVFSSDIFHNHVGIVLEYDEETNLLTIQEGNLDIISNPVWEEAITDYRTIQVTPATMRSMYGNVTYAVPKEGVKMKENTQSILSLREITLNRLKKQFALQDEAKKNEEEEAVTIIQE